MLNYRLFSAASWFSHGIPAYMFFAAVTAAMCFANTASAVELASHRAIYKMSLAAAARGSGVAAAQGAMLYSFNDACDGWASETNVNLSLLYAEGGEVKTSWSFASWEAKDGLSYRFNIRHTRDGVVVENLTGTVERDNPSDSAVAKFSSPKDKIIELPAGTLFPSRHLIDMIKAGQGGKLVFSRTVFDGASLDNPYEINAVIGRDKNATTARGRKAMAMIESAGLKDVPARHIRLAFFAANSQQPEPEFELGVDYRADGVARYIRQDFGDFSIDLLPDKFEILERQDC